MRMLFAFSLVLFSSAVSAQDARFVFLEADQHGWAIDNSTTDDGSTIVGHGRWQALKWDLDGRITPLGEISQPDRDYGEDVSSDGSVVVGVRRENDGPDYLFHWTEETGIVLLPDLGPVSQPIRVSADGQVILGNHDLDVDGNADGAFLWSAATNEVTELGQFEGRHIDGADISGDGTTVVGYAYPSGGGDRFPVRWNASEGASRIEVPNEFESAYAHDANSDGSVILGTVIGRFNAESPFLWTAESGLRVLDMGGRAYDLSADGTMVVGRSSAVGGAFVWNERHGMLSVASILKGAGIDTGEGRLSHVISVSGNGRVISGSAVLPPDNHQEHFLVVLPEVFLFPGDADQDLDFDQADLVQVQQAAKYLTGQPATWGDGDWDSGLGGEPGDPPVGDGVFNQTDVIAALSAGRYMTGPYNAVQLSGTDGDGQTSIVYDSSTGELSVDVPANIELTSINIDSASCIFDPAQNPTRGDTELRCNIFKATFGSSFGSLSFGNVAQPGLSEDFIQNDLTVVGSLAGGGHLGDVDLVYVPEPSAFALLILGLSWLARVRLR